MKTWRRFDGGSLWLLFLFVLGTSLASAATLVPTNATWKYRADGVDLGTSWRSIVYNDFGWSSGPAQLGYGDGDETTVVGGTNGTNSASRPITIYFRRTFFVSGGVSNAALRLLRDDGAIVYVNGVEVRRDNMPVGAANVNTLALSAVGGADETTFFESVIPTSAFVVGTNVIAVEIHQNSSLSTDMSFALELLANISSPWPTLTVEATTPETREQSPLIDVPLIPGVFKISRTGPTNSSLGLSIRLSGTASNSVDYHFVSNSVFIPAGSDSATVEIVAIDDSLSEATETVVLSINPTACPECYVVGSPSSATVSILDDEPANAPPTVSISRPQLNQTFSGPTNVLLRAVANDPEDGHEIAVAFFEGNTKIGDATFIASLCPAPDCPSWDLMWSNVPPGTHTITARATDKNSVTATSTQVTFFVVAQPTNGLPVVRVFATDSNATESAGFNVNTGVFTFTRTGSLSNHLPVSFTLSGSASNYQDYALTSSIVVIPAGSSNAHLILTPWDDAMAEPTESVVLSLGAPFAQYTVGVPSSAMVLIFDNDTNAPPPPPTNATLVAAGSIWKYLDNGTDQGTAWRAPNFNDAAWATGPAQLGFGDGDEQTVLNFFGSNGLSHITFYFRHAFNVTGASGISNAAVRLLRDDGGVVYLNGVEVFRSNMPTGAINYTTLALMAASGADESSNFHSAPIDASLFVEGLNVLAVEIHQVTATSGDLSFDLALNADGGTPPVERTVLHVVATDPQASETGPTAFVNPGQFAIRRSGNLGSSIPVSFLLSGSASNGVDYNFISNHVVIPAGSTQALINLFVREDGISEGLETATLSLRTAVCPAIFPPPPECYVVGDPNSAVVTIQDGPSGSNSPPTVQINEPQEGATFSSPANIVLRAFAQDAQDGNTVQVQFLAGGVSLGFGTFVATVCPAPYCPYYELIWSNAPAGNHTLTARATDSNGASTLSAPVHITVSGPGNTNTFPVVRVFATDPNASERSDSLTDTGRFTFTRTGPVSNSLPVFFTLSGTAIQGSDYFIGTNGVIFPPGSSNVHMVVSAIDDSETEGDETVVLTVVRPPPTAFTPPYNVGTPSNATVVIHDNDPNVPPGSNVTLIAAGSVWKYLDNGSDQGTAWRAPGFDDTSWAAGPAQLGYGDGDEVTVVSGGNSTDKFITTYFRRAFEIGNAGSVSNLVVRLLRDDGGVVYLNGVEVFRSNMPTGAVNYLTLAPLAVGGADESSNLYSATINAGLLVSGQNVIAVEIHQVNAVSSDISFDLELTGQGHEQQPTERTVVHVVATDSAAAELTPNGATNPAQFAVRRTGNLNYAIPVFIRMSGSASNGMDYSFVSNRIVIPAGATQALVNIIPLADNLAEGTETAVLTIEPVGCVAIWPTPPECYAIGSPSQATVTITDATTGTNRPPVAFWLAPPGGSVFTQGMGILLRASANDLDGSISRVEFRRGTNLIGISTGPAGTNYNFFWSNAPIGSHTVFAVAVDNLSARGTSAPVNISVVAKPANNVLPMVTITRPTNGAVFVAPTDILIEAFTRDPDGYADTVEFFADNQKIGEVQIVFIQQPPPNEQIYFDFTWTNPPPGAHVLQARTTDNSGARGTSAPVHITVQGVATVRPAPRDQKKPAVAANGEIYFVVWADQREFNANEWDIYGARIAADGTVLDPNGIRISTLPELQHDPAVASDGRDFLVVWNDTRDENGTDYDIYGARVTAEGIVLETNGFLISDAPSSQFYPSVAFNGSNYLVAWYDYRGTVGLPSNDIYGARVSREGTVLDPQGIPICTAENQQWAPGVAALNGQYFVAWDDSRYPAQSIRGTRVTADGVAINTNGNLISPHFSGHPIRVAANSSSYLTVWSDSRNYETSLYNVFARRIDASGNPTGSDLVLSSAPDMQVGPSVASGGDQFLAVWLDDRFGYTNSRIFGTRIGATGVLDSAGIEIGHAASSAAWNAPGVASLDNQYLVAWVGGRDEHSQSDIVAVRLNFAGERIGETFLVSTVVSNAPPLDSDGDGVPDDRDQCANTPLGTSVGPDGCPLETTLCPPAVQWQHVYGGSGFEGGGNIHQTSDGGYILGGWSYSGINGTRTSANFGRADFWVQRVDAAGNPLWDRAFGGSDYDFLHEVKQTADGGFILVGESYSGTDGNKTSPNRGEADFWVVRLDANGNKLWEQTYGGARIDVALAMQQTADGGFVFGGYSYSAAGGNKSSAGFGNTDFWVVRTDAGGNKLWDASFGGNYYEYLYGLAETSDGGLVLAGMSDSTASGNKTSPNFGFNDYWVVRLDSSGQKVWERTLGGNDHDIATGVAQTSDGGFVVVGGSGSPAGAGKSSPNFGGADYWVVRLTSAGNKVSDHAFGSVLDDYPWAGVALTADDGILVAGSSRGTGGNKTSPFFGGYTDMWMVRLDSSATKLWERSFGGTSDEVTRGFQKTADGGFVVMGESSSPVSGNKTVAAIGEGDFWVLKLGAETTGPCDDDGDGVPNNRDQCPNTPANTVVNEHGCSIAQLCPCAGPWQNHSAYVECVRNTSQSFLNAGLITSAQREEIIAAAQASDCGRRRPRLLIPNQCADELRTNGCRLILEGDGPATVVIECSVDLNQWIPIGTNTLSGAAIEIRDPDACEVVRRFYRIREE